MRHSLGQDILNNMFLFFLIIIAELQELPPVCVASLMDVLYLLTQYIFLKSLFQDKEFELNIRILRVCPVSYSGNLSFRTIFYLIWNKLKLFIRLKKYNFQIWEEDCIFLS